MLLSAFACPGAGQFVQRRWVAATIYATGFMVGFCWVMWVALRIIIGFYRMAFDADYQPESPNLMAMLPPLAIATGFYVVNLFDVVLAQMRIARVANEQRLADE